MQARIAAQVQVQVQGIGTGTATGIDMAHAYMHASTIGTHTHGHGQLDMNPQQRRRDDLYWQHPLTCAVLAPAILLACSSTLSLARLLSSCKAGFLAASTTLSSVSAG